MPFKYTNKAGLAFKLTVYMITGFSLPFVSHPLDSRASTEASPAQIAAAYQM
jgi:hypothetical protein